MPLNVSIVDDIDNGQPITNYRLLVQNDSAPSHSWAADSGNGAATFLEVQDLTPGYGYRFAVQAYNGVSRAYGASTWGPSTTTLFPRKKCAGLMRMVNRERFVQPVTDGCCMAVDEA